MNLKRLSISLGIGAFVALLAWPCSCHGQGISYQRTGGLPLKHDGYVVERHGGGLVVKAALAPTLENVARVIAEKDAAINALDAAVEPVLARLENSSDRERFNWLRAHLEATRALDGALWRYFYQRELAKRGKTAADVLADIGADFETIRRLSKDGSLCAGLGSPVSLMKDIFSKSVEASREVSVSQESRIAGGK